MLDALARSCFHGLAGSHAIRRLASRYGMRRPTSFARRFIAGESVAEAITAARRLQSQGRLITLDHLGESVADADSARAAVGDYRTIIEQVEAAGIERNLSVKLTQLGLDLDRSLCLDNLRRLLDAAAAGDFFIRIDMESSAHVQPTLDVFGTVWDAGYRNVGLVLQSYLRRSMADLEALNRLGVRIRLVKGAYSEPPEVAYGDKAGVDAAFVEMTARLLRDGTRPAIATHDPAILASTRAYAHAHDISPARFEFQMLYGVRRDLQAALIRAGCQLRVYVPFGEQWFPYFMRRLGERPANLMFVLRSLVEERAAPL
jgi:proline dehydrogenase